jgi:hypothetical protein
MFLDSVLHSDSREDDAHNVDLRDNGELVNETVPMKQSCTTHQS